MIYFRCEERACAINEAMMLESGKAATNVTDDTQSLYNRQTQLASLVQGMFQPNHAKSISQSRVSDLSDKYVRKIIVLHTNSIENILDIPPLWPQI